MTIRVFVPYSWSAHQPLDAPNDGSYDATMSNNSYNPGRFPGARLIDTPNELEEGYRFSLDITVRFSDLDGFGHVNNAVFLTYCEMARVAYCNTATNLDVLTGQSYILAHADIDYRSPIYFGELVRVLVRATKVGTKSFRLQYRLLAGKNGVERLVADSQSVQVAYDYKAEKSVAVPAEVGVAFEEFEGRELRDA